jgi:hypothetical protein
VFGHKTAPIIGEDLFWLFDNHICQHIFSVDAADCYSEASASSVIRAGNLENE